MSCQRLLVVGCSTLACHTEGGNMLKWMQPAT